MTSEQKKPKQEKENQDAANGLLNGLGKVIPGLDSFFKKAEKSKTYGPGLKKIRDEMNRRFGKK